MDNYQFEEWKDITGYEGLYQVSNLGRVKSIGYGKIKLLNPGTVGNGYLMVILYKDGKHKTFLVHRLVALAFIPNTENLPQVNHKNEDKTDNRACNLEWCDAKYNNTYGSRTTDMKTVKQFTKEGILVSSYPSINETARQTGFPSKKISDCCHYRRKSWKGFLFKF